MGAPDRRDLERLKALKKLLEDDPRSLAFVTLAEEHIRLGQHAEAAQVAHRGLLSHPDSVAGRLALAVAESEQDHVREALEQIKRALIIDQENPKALVLMGRILLRRGLARRAVQFLAHAVKLAPEEREYEDLLVDARRQAKEGRQAEGAPIFAGVRVPEEASPWSPGAEQSTPSPGDQPLDAQHTVFGSDAVSKLRTSGTRRSPTADALDAALAAIPDSHADARARDPDNEPTKYAGPQMGGSAAEYSRMVGQAEADRARAEAAVRGPDAGGGASKVVVESPKAPSKRSPPPPPPPEQSPPRAEAPEPEPARVQSAEVKKADRGIGPLATRMVDDALWALFGGKAAASEPSAKSEAAGEGGAERPAKAKPDEATPKGGRVVRTSERFGTWTGVAVMLVLCVFAFGVGYAATASRGGPSVEIAGEEIKGLAADLERGGLAAMLAAEEQALQLATESPDLAPLLDAALAEIYARRYAFFGADPKMLEKARERMRAIPPGFHTLEVLSARVILGGAPGGEAEDLDKVDALLALYPDSPKAWTLRSRVAAARGRPEDALGALFTAHAIHPQHRWTLLELARSLARRGAYGSAFAHLDQLQERYPLDVEAAIERFVLGKRTGRDPSEAAAVSALAGLVREETPEVAKDEAGRAALAFAVPRIASGKIQEGLDELAKAEAAFEDSARFKAALAGVFLALGEFDRAEKHYKRALEIEPDVADHHIGIARAIFGRKVELSYDREALSRRLSEKASKAKGIGSIDLPYGVLRFAEGAFELVEVSPSSAVFPEGAYRAVLEKERGGALEPALESATSIAAARLRLANGRVDEAIELLGEVLEKKDLAEAHLELGRARMAKKEYGRAAEELRKALADDALGPPARLLLAKALIAGGDSAKAQAVLEPFEQGRMEAPEALYLLARVRADRGDLEGTAASLERVLAIETSHVAARLLLGEVLHRSKRTERALEVFAAALGAEPDLAEGKLAGGRALGPIALAYLGRLEVERDRRRGLLLLRRSLEHEDAPVEAHFFLGKALMAKKKGRKDGKRALEQYLKIGDSPELRAEAERLLKRR